MTTVLLPPFPYLSFVVGITDFKYFQCCKQIFFFSVVRDGMQIQEITAF